MEDGESDLGFPFCDFKATMVPLPKIPKAFCNTGTEKEREREGWHSRNNIVLCHDSEIVDHFKAQSNTRNEGNSLIVHPPLIKGTFEHFSFF